jgi:hypothetical protein
MYHHERFWALAFVLLGLAAPSKGGAATYEAGLLLGTHGGPGGTAQVTVADFSPNLRWKARLGATYSTRDPGNPEDARRIFINDATNGTPDEKGRLWTLSLDLVVPVWAGRGGSVVSLYGGPRHGSFTANFAFIGGNEDFDIRERTWAFGGGLEDHLPLGRRTSLLLQAGADYYLEDGLKGHDTTYTPDDENVNPRKDFDYGDADEAVNQPKLEARAMAGILECWGK